MFSGTFLNWFRLQLGTQPIAGRILAPGYFLNCKELLEATLSIGTVLRVKQAYSSLLLSGLFD